AMGEKEGGSIAQFDVTARFRWLTATRSSALQVSKTHAGLSYDLEKTTQRLFEELVL
ncbi:MAG: phage gp37-like protein, partial [Roseivirga sp.]